MPCFCPEFTIAVGMGLGYTKCDECEHEADALCHQPLSPETAAILERRKARLLASTPPAAQSAGRE